MTTSVVGFTTFPVQFGLDGEDIIADIPLGPDACPTVPLPADDLRAIFEDEFEGDF